MANPTISLPDELQKRIDDTRHATTSRSEWIRDAVRLRLHLESVGEWDVLMARLEEEDTNDNHHPAEADD